MGIELDHVDIGIVHLNKCLVYISICYRNNFHLVMKIIGGQLEGTTSSAAGAGSHQAAITFHMPYLLNPFLDGGQRYPPPLVDILKKSD